MAVFFSARRKENGDSIQCGIAAHLRTNLVRLAFQKNVGAFQQAKPVSPAAVRRIPAGTVPLPGAMSFVRIPLYCG